MENLWLITLKPVNTREFTCICRLCGFAIGGYELDGDMCLFKFVNMRINTGRREPCI